MAEKEKFKRYAKNLALIGEDGQNKLFAAKVLVVGAGGLGSPVLLYLAVAGVGKIGICDGDIVSITNLNRQLLYSEADVGLQKAKVAVEKLQVLNPQPDYEEIAAFVTAENAEKICQGYDIIVDCLDSLAARYILNDACVALKKPLVHAGVSQFYGQQFTYVPNSPCLRCVLPKLAEGDLGKENSANGILGATAGFMGSKEALEVIKLILGLPVNNGNLLYYDALNDEYDRVPVRVDPNCLCQKLK